MATKKERESAKKQRIKRARYIVDNNEITQQSEYSSAYEKEYSESISQPSIVRIFKEAGIYKDKDTNRYMYYQSQEDIEADRQKELKDALEYMLEKYSFSAEYTASKDKEFILSVDPDSTTLTAKAIYDYCNGNIFIFYGYGCLLIKCKSKPEYGKLLQFIKSFYRLS